MQLMKMKYKAFEFQANPSLIEVSKSKKINERPLLDAGSAVREISKNAAVISVQGRFYGENAQTLAYELEILNDEKGPGWLFLPNGDCFDAYFKSLNLKMDASKNSVYYSAVFVENENHKLYKSEFPYTVALDHENAFDIAERCGVSVESIMQHNDIKTPFDIKKGDKVVLK